MLESVILTAGRGSRLKPFTEHVPKCLLYFPGGSLIDHHIRHLAGAKVSAIYIVCGYMEEDIAQYVLPRYPGCKIVTQTEEIGTAADGLLTIANLVAGDFLAVHGDHYFSYNLFDDLLADHSMGEITFLVEEPGKHGSIGYDLRCLYHAETKEVCYSLGSKTTGRSPKWREMTLVDGCMVLPAQIFEMICESRGANSANPDMDHVFAYISDHGLARMKGVVVRNWWANINDPVAVARTLKRLYAERT